MLEILQLALSGFWQFVGTGLLLSLVLQFLFLCWNRLWRHMNIRKQGYPPMHCDADGDFKENKK